MERIKANLRQLDAFGQGVNFKVNGQDKYGTAFGTLLTMAIYVVILLYGQMKGVRLYHRLDTQHQISTHEDAIGIDESFTFEDLQANFAFGLWTNTFTPLTPDQFKDYVYLEAKIEVTRFNRETQ